MYLETSIQYLAIIIKYFKKLEYINYEYGEISKIMVENPFRLIVFFKESQSIFLDKNLNELY